jgi:hypothetical protein
MSKNPSKGYNKEDMNEKYPKKKKKTILLTAHFVLR